MPLFRSGPKHGPDEISVRMTITGVCRHCHRTGTATLVAYYSGEILIRCNNPSCKTANEFEPDNKSYNNPDYFKPFRSDSDEGYHDKSV